MRFKQRSFVTPLLTEVENIAVLAGKRILEIRNSRSFSISTKSDTSPVTDADMAAHHLIMAALPKVSSDLIISEESDLSQLEEKYHQRFWLVDPLDGTKDFIAGKDSFVVSIGLIENKRPILGVLYAPVSQELYSAELNSGATLNGKSIFNKSTRQEFIAFASGSNPSPRFLSFMKHFNIKTVERFGSALKMGRLAEGHADLYPRFGQTFEWDTAAGHAILNETGCKLIDANTGTELEYGKKGFLNHGFIASRSNLDFIPPGGVKNLKINF